MSDILGTLCSAPTKGGAVIIVLTSRNSKVASRHVIAGRVDFCSRVAGMPFVFTNPNVGRRGGPMSRLLARPALSLLPALYSLTNVPIPTRGTKVDLTPALGKRGRGGARPCIMSR